MGEKKVKIAAQAKATVCQSPNHSRPSTTFWDTATAAKDARSLARWERPLAYTMRARARVWVFADSFGKTGAKIWKKNTYYRS